MNAFSLLLLAAVPGSDSLAIRALDDAPAVRLWLNNNRQFREGERARVEVESRDDGYLLVLNYDTEGRLRVLFPIDPRDDSFVRGGRRYEVSGRGDRGSFIASNSGDGLVYAAVSPDPFDVRAYEAADNWDYTRFSIDPESSDPEADITELLERIAGERGFDYDVLDYRVWGYRDYRPVTAWYPRPYGFYDDVYCDYWSRPSLFGCRYWWPGYYGYSRYGFGYGYGGYYGRGYYGGFWDPWYRGRYITYPASGRWPVVVGRPRGYTIVRRTPGTTRGDRIPGSFRGSFDGSNRPSVIDYRPRTAGRARPGSERPSGVSRPDGGRPSGVDRGSSGSRPRGRRVNPSDARPNVERDRPSADGRRPSVDDRPSAGRQPSTDRDRGSSGSSGRARPSDRSRGSRRPAGELLESRPIGTRVSDDPIIRRRVEPARPSEPRRVDVPGRRVESRDVGADARRTRIEAPARRDPPPSRRVEAPTRRESPAPRRVEAPARRDPPAPRRANAPRRDPPRVSAPAASRPSRGSGSDRARRPRKP